VSVLLTKLRGRVRNKLRALDAKMPGPTQLETDMAVCDAFVALSSELPARTLYTASGLTISAGTDLFSLPITVASSGYGTGSVEYAGMVDLQRVTDGRWLERKTLNELESFIFTGAIQLGIPDLFALYEDGGNVVRGRCYPGARAATVCHLYSSLTPDDLRDWVGTGGAEGLETVTVNLGRYGIAALVDYASAMLMKRMDPDMLKKRGINPQYADDLMGEAGTLLYQEAAQRNAIESNGQTQRRVS